MNEPRIDGRNTSALQDDDPLTLEAAAWLLKLCGEHVRAHEIAEWQQWLASSQAHRAAFERAQAVWNAVPRIASVPWPTDLEVAGDDYDARLPVSRHGERTRRPSRRVALTMAAALAVCAIGAAIVWSVRSGSPDVLQTEIGENRRIALSDGSHVTLGGASRLRFALMADRRAVEVEQGEVFFEVAKDARRRFVVRAGAARITAIGTAFNVRRAVDRIEVAVTDGVVDVASLRSASAAATSPALNEIRLTAGQQASVVSGSLLAPAPADIPIVLARRSGRLQYAAEPLRYVIADLARYSKLPIEIAGARTGDLLVTATVREDDLHGWLQGLEKALPVSITFEDERITIAAR